MVKLKLYKPQQYPATFTSIKLIILQSTSHGESNILVSDGSDLKFEWNCEGGPIEVDLALSHNPGCNIH